MKDNKFRDRKLALLLYPDDPTHCEAMEKIKTSYDYVAILHDKDFTEDGEIKKPHWHVVLRFGNATWNSAVAKDLGIEQNYTEKIRNMNNAILYLIHYNDSDKYQYNIDECFGTLKNKIVQIINADSKTEGEKVVELIDYITSKKSQVSVTEFAVFCANNGYWAEFRRSASILCKIIDEHNFKFKDFE